MIRNVIFQMWDLSTGLELAKKDSVMEEQGGPSPEELMRMFDQCDLSNSRCTTPSVSPSPSLLCTNNIASSPHSCPPTGGGGTPKSNRRLQSHQQQTNTNQSDQSEEQLTKGVNGNEKSQSLFEDSTSNV